MKEFLIFATLSALITCSNCQGACIPGYFECEQAKPGKSPCIPPDQVCDGISDCEFAEDEGKEDCQTNYQCPLTDFSCSNGLCIPLSGKCDHNNDCGDGSDEGNFCGYPICYSSQFTCGNGRCIETSLTCDGKDDCRDNSDEADCGCDPNDYVCGDGTCVGEQQLCDGFNHCADKTDESNCGTNECLTQNSCTELCIDTPNSFKCGCLSGQKLKEDSVTCEDINECTEQPWVCSQRCTNTDGSYICYCNSGYTQNAAGSCIHSDDIDPYLLFSNNHYIRRIGLTGDDYQLLSDGFYLVAATDFDLEREEMYSIDYLAKQIVRSKLDGSAKTTIVANDIEEGEGIAIDWIGRKIYWTDRGLDTIDVANLDGTSRKTIIRDNLFDPRGITVDPRNGYLYWSDWGLRPYIGRSSMDGTGATEFHDDLVGWPNGLTICFETDKLYWADAHLDHIVYSNLDGSGVTLLLDEGVGHPFAVTVFEDYVYWTDWNVKTINRANKWTGEGAEVMQTTLHRPFDIHVVHPLRQDSSISNPCGVNNAGCSHLCLLGESYSLGFPTAKCACPNNFILKTDLKTCEAQCTNQQFKCANDDRCIPYYWKCDGEVDCHDGSDEYDACPERVCTSGQYQCDNLACTLIQFVCDGDDDCGDFSDESHCSTAECNPWEFRCDSGQCIDVDLVCQQREHCADGSDEHAVTCSDHVCSEGYFQCDNGYCIPDYWRCDLDNDCGDFSDEPVTECQSVTCPTGWYSCLNNYRCIPEYAVCDGLNQCRTGGSDEFYSLCRDRTCSPGEFRCNNKKCIPLRWRCDFDNDCGDYSDESSCSTYRPCSESEHRCTSGKCIPWYKICDITVDCNDGSDEFKCNEPRCDVGEYQCTSGHCIPEDYRCDGFPDCYHWDDETDGCNDRNCKEDELSCRNNVCVPKDYECDGQDDCGDGSDELNCGACPENKFQCNSTTICIHSFLMCNGYQDCPDSSDETDKSCTPQPELCKYDEFKCENSICVPVTKLCNGFDDCNDNSDEHGCHKEDENVNECVTGAAMCERVCTDLEYGFACSCGEGYTLSQVDQFSCADYNECNDNPCPQVCVNTKGNYTCECARGYFDIFGDGRDCQTEDGNEYLIFSDGPTIKRYYFSTKNVDVFIKEQGRIEDLDVDVQNNYVYWIDSQEFEIKRAVLGGSNEGALQEIQRDLKQPRGITCDWVAGNIYWTDWGDQNLFDGRRRRALSSDPSITVANSDGQNARILIDKDLDKPFSIVVNPAKGLIYWTDQGEFPKIEVAWMTGEHREELVTRDLIEPTGLTIDFANYQTVYFSDRKENLIFSMNFDGSNLRAVKGGESLLNPYQIEVFGSNFYWSTSSTKDNGNILVGDKIKSNGMESLVSDIGRHAALKMFHSERYPPFSNPCDNHPCSHLCLIIPKGSDDLDYQCACPDGYGFIDEKTCQKGYYECNGRPCLNGGTCTVSVSGYTCFCTNDFDGTNCEHKKASCDCGDGVCTENGFCKCSDGSEKSFCSAQSTGGEDDEVSNLVPIMAGLLALSVIIIVCIVLFVLLRLKRRKRESTGAVSYRTGPNVANINSVSGIEGDVGVENPGYSTIGAIGGGIDEKVPIDQLDEKYAGLPPDLIHVALGNQPMDPPPAYTEN
ncbi:prolow-density lipoprotein receptor-related protein 1-like [Antedon mediterranea]|uniref:prolow-density lipoprotein receptor-related protein 1-like n=1 Tax=Antedon mediterranea TaxID=105859 RepID=UPI003AF986F6